MTGRITVIKVYVFAIPIIETVARTKPKKLEPVSPINVLAGLKLYGKNPISPPNKATVRISGSSLDPFNIKINGKAINMGIWDTSGKEAYRALFSNLYGGISLAIIVYSIDDKESFNNVESWLFNLMEKASEDVKIFLIGNKSDLENNREVTKEEGEKFKLEQCLDLFFETSAKNGNNAKNVFIEAAKMLYDDEQN